MKVGISQSNYIPWRGYFDFIDDVDLFVFYDDVKYTHRDWRNRNRIRTAAGLIWLTVPVLHDQGTLIQDACIDYRSRWIDKHVGSLKSSYAKAPHFGALASEFFDILASKFETISTLNVAICRWVMQKLKIRTRVMMSREIGESGDKTERPLRILRKLGATHYLSGPTARAYTDLDAFRDAGISVSFKSYDYGSYPQLHEGFEGAVSVLDLLFNCGEESRRHLKSAIPAFADDSIARPSTVP